MNFAFILKLIPAIISLMRMAEAMKPKKGSGKEKKAIVVDSMKGVVGAVAAVSTGGQKETWKAIEVVLDPVIDVCVAVANAFGLFKKE